MPTPLGSLIAYYRNDRGVRQSDLADTLGRSKYWMNQVERGRRAVSDSELVEIADALELSEGYRRALALAADESKTTLRLPPHASPLETRMVNRLVAAIGRMDPRFVEDTLKRLPPAGSIVP